jgi:hypothetical protein
MRLQQNHRLARPLKMSRIRSLNSKLINSRHYCSSYNRLCI